MADIAALPPARWPGGSVGLVHVPGGILSVEWLSAGPPLLMLHGWTLDRRMWLPQLPLARDFTLIGIDRRGFGQSTAPADLAVEPEDVLRVADALGLARFHLLGMSQGGRVALALAQRAPDRLLSLIVQGTALDGVAAPDEAVPVAAMAIAVRRGDLRSMRALVHGHALMQVTTAKDAVLIAEMLASYDGRDLLVPDHRLPVTADVITGAGFPVTAIVGTNDTPQRRANVAALVAAGASAVELPAAGHLCNIDCPAAFNAALRAGIDCKRPR